MSTLDKIKSGTFVLAGVQKGTRCDITLIYDEEGNARIVAARLVRTRKKKSNATATTKSKVRSNDDL